MGSDVSGPIYSRPPWSCSAADGPGSPLRGAEPSRAPQLRHPEGERTSAGLRRRCPPGAARGRRSSAAAAAITAPGAKRSEAGRGGTERNGAAQCCGQSRGSADGCEPTLSTAGAARLCASPSFRSPSSATRREEPGKEQRSGVTAMAAGTTSGPCRAVPCSLRGSGAAGGARPSLCSQTRNIIYFSVLCGKLSLFLFKYLGNRACYLAEDLCRWLFVSRDWASLCVRCAANEAVRLLPFQSRTTRRSLQPASNGKEEPCAVKANL